MCDENELPQGVDSGRGRDVRSASRPPDRGPGPSVALFMTILVVLALIVIALVMLGQNLVVALGAPATLVAVTIAALKWLRGGD